MNWDCSLSCFGCSEGTVKHCVLGARGTHALFTCEKPIVWVYPSSSSPLISHKHWAIRSNARKINSYSIHTETLNANCLIQQDWIVSHDYFTPHYIIIFTIIMTIRYVQIIKGDASISSVLSKGSSKWGDLSRWPDSYSS